jgi:RNA polymerase sigma factor (sigma-70 family)
MDEADLAAMAEAVALGMSKRVDEIQSPWRYALAALTGRIQEWFRAHPAKTVSFETEDELDRQIEPDDQFEPGVERSLLFAEMRHQLSGRDRQICILLEQEFSSPQEIAQVLEISYAAAAKALQRARDRMASIVKGESPSLNFHGTPFA